jgi:hypothetical protein
MTMKMTEKKLADMILRLIDAQGKCVISDDLLREALDRRSDASAELKPLIAPYDEQLAKFCSRNRLTAVPGPVRGRTVFARSESATVA